ncbi:unnamed protein product, partial [Onchocerca flexuosa]|uniref:Coatomer subunit zeta n=1 Tax=Onchocerca flexuosa TaxID=387005 RepID=A0A183HQG9_9BILA
MTCLYSIKGIAILDQDGNRILAKQRWNFFFLQYYDDKVFPSTKEQKTFEKNLFQKTCKANAEIILLDGMICVYRSNVDLFFYVIGGADQNELILISALNCLYDSISLVLRKNVEKKALIDDMDIAMLIIDEICDNGFVN